MKKIFKILSILVMVFVLFSCANPSSNPEEPTVTEPQGYSITFITEKPAQQPVADLLNSLPDYKNLKEGTEVEFPTIIYGYGHNGEEKCTLYITESSEYKVTIYYEGNITSVVVGNEDIEIKVYVDRVDPL
ncbi:MAG: hypothetical protein K6C98_06440 [Treponema sp.]|nr:hypothetical protein [Treponema sp.]